ncbi:MAG: RibD family protein [Rhodanobacteraceae bacterium]
MSVTPLYPSSAEPVSLQGLYLRERLPSPFLYSNFITSLDGRIAVAQSGRETHAVPRETSNPRDWRLYQELAAQADVVITTGRFLRQTQKGEAQDAIPIGGKYADLRRWRIDHGLSAQPDIAIVSGSLDLPVDPLTAMSKDRNVRVLTGSESDAGRKRALRDAGIEVLEAGAGTRVEGKRLRRALEATGATRMYSVAGPQVLHTLVAGQALDRLYLSLAGRLLGGTEFDTLCIGSRLQPAPKLRLADLHFDAEAPAGAGQLLAAYDLDYT